MDRCALSLELLGNLLINATAAYIVEYWAEIIFLIFRENFSAVTINQTRSKHAGHHVLRARA